MKRTLFLSALVAGVALALAAGSYSVLAGSGPVTGVAGVVMGVEDPDDDDDADDVDDDDDADDDADDVSVQAGEDGDDAEGAQHIAQVIADTFGGDLTAEASDVSQADVLALYEEGIGFGALFKLYVLAAAMDTSVGDLLDTIDKNSDGEYEFAFGKLFREWEDEVSVLTDGEDGMPKNLGQAVSGSKKSDKVVTAAADDDGDDDDGQGPPDHAPAHGRR